MEETTRMYLQLEEESRNYGFSILRARPTGVSSVPLKTVEILSQEDYVSTVGRRENGFAETQCGNQERINQSIRVYKELEKAVKLNLKDLETETTLKASEPFFEKLLKKYGSYPDVSDYLQDMHQDVLKNLDLFIAEEDTSGMGFFRNMDKKSALRRYQVNHFVDCSDLQYAPVIFESNPTYSNLFGQI